MALIQLKNLIKRYSNVLAVDNVSLQVEKNEIFGLVGPNGAGKSSTIKMIIGLLKPNSGEIIVDNKNVQKNPLEVKKILGVVPQDLAIYDNISALENVEFFGSLYGLGRKDLRDMSKEALEFVGLYEKRMQKPKSFSGGMKRRLNIACSIVHQPQIIVMDEPTVGIDPQSRNHILDSVKELNNRGVTVIYTSHYMEEVESICHRVGIIDHGKLIACGTKNELKSLISTEEIILIETYNLLPDTLNEISELNGIKSVKLNENTLQLKTLSAQNNLQDIIYILSQNNVKISNISLKEPNLESVFLSLTGRSLRD